MSDRRSSLPHQAFLTSSADTPIHGIRSASLAPPKLKALTHSDFRRFRKAFSRFIAATRQGRIDLVADAVCSLFSPPVCNGSACALCRDSVVQTLQRLCEKPPCKCLYVVSAM